MPAHGRATAAPEGSGVGPLPGKDADGSGSLDEHYGPARRAAAPVTTTAAAMMDRLQRPDDWDRVSKQDWAVFGLVQQACVIGLLSLLYVGVSLRIEEGLTLRVAAQYVLTVLMGIQLALMYVRVRKLRGGE